MDGKGFVWVECVWIGLCVWNCSIHKFIYAVLIIISCIKIQALYVLIFEIDVAVTVCVGVGRHIDPCPQVVWIPFLTVLEHIFQYFNKFEHLSEQMYCKYV